MKKYLPTNSATVMVAWVIDGDLIAVVPEDGLPGIAWRVSDDSTLFEGAEGVEIFHLKIEEICSRNTWSSVFSFLRRLVDDEVESPPSDDSIERFIRAEFQDLARKVDAFEASMILTDASALLREEQENKARQEFGYWLKPTEPLWIP